MEIKINNNLAPNSKKKSKWQEFIKYFLQNKMLYFLVIPGIIYLFIFNYLPMYGVVIAFKNFDVVKGIWGSPWIGFDNFKYLFSSNDFYVVFRNSILISIYRLFWGFPAPIILAIMLNEIRSVMFKRSIQTIVYLPHFISWVVIAGILYNFLSPADGLINELIKLFGGQPVAFLQSPKYFRSVLVISDIWKEIGWGTIVYLAAMTGIDPELYEAAVIDGASRIQRILYITIPGIASTIIVLLVLRMGSVLRNGFEQIFMLYNPLVYEVADVFETYTYRVGIMEGRFSYATAIGIFQSVIGLVMILTTNRLAKKFGDGGLW